MLRGHLPNGMRVCCAILAKQCRGMQEGLALVSQRGRCRVTITHIMALRCDTEAPLERAEPVHLALSPLIFHARFPR